jgi:hypothetical protein
MTAVLPELRGLPSGLVLDGELVAWKGTEPYFPHICRRVLNRDMSVPMTFVVFDVLQRDGVDLTRQAVPRAPTRARGPQPGRPSLDDMRAVRRRTSALHRGLRARPRGRRGEEPHESLPAQ